MAKKAYSPDPKAETIKRIQRTEAYAEKVRQLFAATVNEILALNKSVPTLDEGVMYSFDGDNMRIQKKVEALLRQLHSTTTTAIKKGITLEWEQANVECDKLIASCFGKKVLSSPEFSAWNNRNMAAMNAFADRTEDGLNLSGRIWQSVQQLRDEMEIAMTVAIGEGDSAQSISRKVRQYLNDPDLMFRRFRFKKGEDEQGKPIYGRKWKKRIKDEKTGKYRWIDYDRSDYKTGSGVYKSSAKNAMRVARSETNIAYRRADNERWQQMDFVLGQRIQLSKNHPKKDICDKLAGDYPKDFVFDGWHVQCFCFATPILIDEDEMAKVTEAFLKGEKYTPRGKQISEYPANFKDWVRDNKENILASRDRGTEPYFIRNNASAIDEILNPKPKELTIAEKAALRHEARTPEQEAAIRNAWAERQKKHQQIKTAANNIAKVAGDYGEVDYSALQKYIDAGDLSAMQTETKKVAQAILAAKKAEQALADIIPDAHKQHQIFTLAELRNAYNSIQKVFNRFSWDFADEINLQDLKKKLSYEISWMETKGRKYATWEIARDAYKRRLSDVEHKLQMFQVKNDISSELALLNTSKSNIAKQLISEFNALFIDNHADISVLKSKATLIKDKAVELQAKRAYQAKKLTSAFNPKSDAETKKDFIAYCKKIGVSINERDVVVDKGFIHLQGDQHKYLYDALKVETKSEHDQLWNHRNEGIGRWGASGYIKTGNSFQINKDFRKTKVVGHLDAKAIATLEANGATADDIKTIQLLDKKIGEFSLPFPMRVTRYVGYNALKSIFKSKITTSTNSEILKSIKTGNGIINADPSFLSASTNELQNVFTHLPIKIEIEVPPHTPMYFSNNYIESEVVFGRSTKLNFISASLNRDYITIRCRMTK
jgi:hypothetical protein